MKKLFETAAVLSLLLTTGSALAADIATRPHAKASISEAVYSWTGFYVGANAGYTSPHRNHLDVSGTDTGGDGLGTLLELGLLPSRIASKPSGFLGGAQAGYNLQSGLLVYGIEADIQGVSARDNFGFVSIPPSTPRTLTGSNKLNWLATARARLGVTVTPTALLYVTGGLAAGEHELTLSTACPACALPAPSSSASRKTSAGWTAGAGLEWALARNWSLKGEYLYYDLGENGATVTYDYVMWTSSLTTHVDNSGHIVRLGINYRLAGD
jgi:outer membrane immunogenic protein